MTAINERARTSRAPRLVDPPPARRRIARRHADAVIQAEVRRLARALAGGEEGRIKRLSVDFFASSDGATS